MQAALICIRWVACDIIIESDVTGGRPLAVKSLFTFLQCVTNSLDTMGGGQKCAFKGCDVSSKTDKDVSFHKLPKIEKVRDLWLKFCRIPEDAPKSSVICSNHFTPCSFRVDYKQHQEITGLKTARQLVTGGK